MQKPTPLRIIAVLAVVSTLLLLATWQSGLTGQICEKAANQQNEDCTSYNLLFFVLIKLREIVDHNDGFITALATLAIAAFTATLWKSTHDLGVAGEEQMRLIEANAKQQSIDMQASIKVTEDTAKKELRAYVTVEPDGINQLIGRMAVIGQVRLRNVGRLPARKVTLIVKMKRSAQPEEDPSCRTREFDASEDRSTYSDRVVNPGGDMLQGSEDTLPISDLAVEHYNVYVFGIAKYDNGYGDPCFTRFCHRYSTDGRLKGLELKEPPPVTRSVIGREKARYHNYGNSAELPDKAEGNT
ncbi:hypothetical protein FJ934_20485 [Mesorhizobium sp. B2-4-12]|uniref:hypothetical protein n=1 Tax=Mesorhizobium sp. B2-4-12 TaxID=2589937 RepID=UPI00112949CA|nr:hypothetical protein [Mesorhizobium sp. B2-4-12]TPK92658.1 hypothetical protein FJ934_20485 [Mesorhizobium sp. B2-4-12]